MLTYLGVAVVAFAGGVVITLFRSKIGAWLERRAAANKITAAQKLIADAAAAEKALVAAKAVVAATAMPTPPLNPKP